MKLGGSWDLAVVWYMVVVWLSPPFAKLRGTTAMEDNAGTIRMQSPRTDRDLIVKGQNAVQGRYPYFATLKHFCGGALIAPDIILTAGHCWFEQHISPKVGTYSFHTDVRNVDYEQFEIAEKVRHPRWVYVGDDEFIRDFSIIKLNGQSTNPVIRINRRDSFPRDGQEVIAMGMGYTDQNFDSRSDVLQQVALNAIPNDICEEAFDLERNISYEGRIHPSMMCSTGGPNNERDSCSYDSGSPIIVPGRTPHDDVLVALVSWGEMCADPSFPGVNARVSFASDWIDAMVCAMSENPPSDFHCHRPRLDQHNLGLLSVLTVGSIGLLACSSLVYYLLIVRGKKLKTVDICDVEKKTLFLKTTESLSYDSIE